MLVFVLECSDFSVHCSVGQQNFKWTLRRGEGGGGSDLNVQLTLSGRKVNMSTAPKHIRAYAMKLFCKLGVV